mmetsp:Transcript_15451/g.43929  ORF Transcript_15451/g.43929 Transcript_15451/m.43929 type:complete len:227 (+) Transcript_15451:1875-2555(+)
MVPEQVPEQRQRQGARAREGHDRDLRGDLGRDAAHAREIPLHLQPAGSVEGESGPVPVHKAVPQEPRGPRPVLGARVPAGVPGPPCERPGLLVVPGDSEDVDADALQAAVGLRREDGAPHLRGFRGQQAGVLPGGGQPPAAVRRAPKLPHGLQPDGEAADGAGAVPVGRRARVPDRAGAEDAPGQRAARGGGRQRAQEPGDAGHLRGGLRVPPHRDLEELRDRGLA